MSGCDSRYDYEPISAEIQKHIESEETRKALIKYHRDKQMTPVREEFLGLPKETLSTEGLDRLMAKALTEDNISSSEVISLLQTLFLERYGDKFFKERVPNGSLVAINQGYDTFDYTVIEANFDGTYRVRGNRMYDHEEHTIFEKVIRVGPPEPVVVQTFPVFTARDQGD